MYGCSIHPDLLKKAVQGVQSSYEMASNVLDAESAHKRSINSHSQIYKSVKLVSTPLEYIRTLSNAVNDRDAASSIIANIDGGHIKSKGAGRSFEAMIATVYRPENIKDVDKHHNSITKKSTVASAKSDAQQTMNALFKSACEEQGMNKIQKRERSPLNNKELAPKTNESSKKSTKLIYQVVDSLLQELYI